MILNIKSGLPSGLTPGRVFSLILPVALLLPYGAAGQVEQEEQHYTLDSVEVHEQPAEHSDLYLRSLEGTAVYAGRKTEVIFLDGMLANRAGNNAREIYARIAGLNVWETESGLQLNIGGRGLNPNRAANFNVRQNGYDISADALGYPESYYTPPPEALEAIQIIRGAASLQYGTQFGGMVNFVMKKPPREEGTEVISRQTAGAYGLLNTFNSVAGRKGRLGYYGFIYYKQGDGWRENAGYNGLSGHVHVAYALNERSRIALEATHLDYLEQQAGGLSDRMYREDPRQSNRSRNWFAVDWNLLQLNLQHKTRINGQVDVKLYGLLGSREALGFRNYRPEAEDITEGRESYREMIDGRFRNIGLEVRYLQPYRLAGSRAVMLAGSRTYRVWNQGRQGLGSGSTGADLGFADHPENLTSDYDYPNFNQSLFTENVFFLSDQLSITPGLRFEWINTRSEGYYREIQKDLAGNILINETHPSAFERKRAFLIAGLTAEYKQPGGHSVYAGFCQNYRAITFSDIHIVNPSFVIDTNIRDEKGYSLELGMRSQSRPRLQYDISAFMLNYNNRIGEIAFVEEQTGRIKNKRTNIGRAVIYGLETYLRWTALAPEGTGNRLSLFSNLSLLGSAYRRSLQPNVTGNRVEFVPLFNLKAGAEAKWRRWEGRFQVTHLSEQYSDASNDRDGGPSAVTGLIPAFTVLDMALATSWGHFRLEGGVNNLADTRYFTRRATGYPGPGIIPSPGRTFYLTLQFAWPGKTQ